MNQQPTPTPAALYARVSSDRQDANLSVAARLRVLRDYAEKNGYSVVREYMDEAESGRIADRPVNGGGIVDHYGGRKVDHLA